MDKNVIEEVKATDEQLDEFASAVGAKRDNVAEPKDGRAAKLPASKEPNSEPMPHIDTKNGPSSKVEVIQWLTDYVAGLEVGTAMELFAKLKAEFASKDATNHGAPKGSQTAAYNKSTIAAKEDVTNLLGGDELSEETKTKIATIFEAALGVRANELEASLEEEYAAKLEEKSAELASELEVKVADMFKHLAEGWKKDNELALKSQLQVEAAESFISGLKGLFAEHYVAIPDDGVDAVTALNTEIEDLEVKLSEEVESAIALRKELDALKAEKILESAIADLADTQKEKVRKLAEAVEFTSVEEFTQKVTTLAEAVVPAKAATALNEGAVDPIDPLEETAKGPTLDPDMAAYVAGLKRTIKR